MDLLLAHWEDGQKNNINIKFRTGLPAGSSPANGPLPGLKKFTILTNISTECLLKVVTCLPSHDRLKIQADFRV